MFFCIFIFCSLFFFWQFYSYSAAINKVTHVMCCRCRLKHVMRKISSSWLVVKRWKYKFNHDVPVPPQYYRECRLQDFSFSYALMLLCRRSYWQSFEIGVLIVQKTRKWIVQQQRAQHVPQKTRLIHQELFLPRQKASHCAPHLCWHLCLLLWETCSPLFCLQ